MRQYIDGRVRQRFENALGHRRFLHVQPGMDRHQHDVEVLQDLVG
jgi:hypothetical protein